MRLPDTMKTMNAKTMCAAGASAIGLVVLGGSWLGWKYVVQPYLMRKRTHSVNMPVAAHASEEPNLRKEPAAMHVRSAGPEAMRDDPGHAWDAVDQASDESFPSSDPPSHSPGAATAMGVAADATEMSEEDDGETPPARRRTKTAKSKHIH